MGKNLTGGKHKGRKNNANHVAPKRVDDLKRNTDKEALECYAKCLKPLGNRRFEVECWHDSILKTLHCRLAGSCRKKIQKDAFVLVQLFPFNLNQGQIVAVYDPDEVNLLKKTGHWDFPAKDSRDDEDPFNVWPDEIDILDKDEERGVNDHVHDQVRENDLAKEKTLSSQDFDRQAI